MDPRDSGDPGRSDDFRPRETGVKLLAFQKQTLLHVQAEFQQGLILSSKMRKAKVRISHGDLGDCSDSVDP